MVINITVPNLEKKVIWVKNIGNVASNVDRLPLTMDTPVTDSASRTRSYRIEASPSSMNKSDFSEKIIRLPTTVSEPSEGRKVTTTNVTGGQRRINVDSMNFTKKVLHCDWHPSENVVAIATSNNLFFYSANQAKGEA